MTPNEERRAKVLSALKEMLAEDPLPLVIKTVGDGFEAMGVRTLIACIKQGIPVPLYENRIQQTDMAGWGVSTLGAKIGAFLTTLAQPHPRRPTRR